MSRKILKIVFQALGGLLGLMGLGLLWMTITMISHSGQGLLQGQETLHAGFTLYFWFFGVVLSGLLCFVGYRAVFRFSRVEVRMVLAALTYFLWSTIKVPVPRASDSEWPELLFLLSIVAAYMLYRLAARFCCAYLFGAPAAAGPGPMAEAPGQS